MKRGIIFAVGAATLTLSRLCAAGPADYVYTPTVEYGEREIDFKAGRANTHDADQNSAAEKMQIQIVANDRLFMAVLYRSLAEK